MRQVFEMITRVATSNATILIRGESGTGKELVANAVHYNSKRTDKPFIKVNLAALPETLVESELFGHEKGAFTGALSRKSGRFELAQGGTVFLDEIGDLSTTVQLKLLRVIQEREFTRLGGTTTLKADVRLVAATHRDLEKLVAEGIFREDLYYRLNVFPIYLPPLRERKADIPLLAEHFLSRHAAEQGKPTRRLSQAALDLLMQYHWPGNVRELENVIERALLVCDAETILSAHLPPSLHPPACAYPRRRQTGPAAQSHEPGLPGGKPGAGTHRRGPHRHPGEPKSGRRLSSTRVCASWAIKSSATAWTPGSSGAVNVAAARKICSAEILVGVLLPWSLIVCYPKIFTQGSRENITVSSIEHPCRPTKMAFHQNCLPFM